MIYAYLMQEGKSRANSIGARVKRRRQEDGLAQAALARRLSINQSTVSRIERGLVVKGDAASRLQAYADVAAEEQSQEEILKKISLSPELRALVLLVLSEAI